MAISFLVYIDESGDEGFHFDKGSSKWFVLSAIITQKQTDLTTVKLIDRVRKQVFNRADNEPLHFRKLKHEQRLPFIAQIASADLKAVSVMIHKPSIRQTANFHERNRLYFYAVQRLLERVSWHCHIQKDQLSIGDGSARIIFSNRGGMKYEELRAYLKDLAQNPEVEIDWNIISTNKRQIVAYSHEKRMGLQIADAVASSFFYAINLNQYGFVEDRYVRMLKPIIFANSGKYQDYGIKLWPKETNVLLESIAEYAWLRNDYHFKIGPEA